MTKPLSWEVKESFDPCNKESSSQEPYVQLVTRNQKSKENEKVGGNLENKSLKYYQKYGYMQDENMKSSEK